MLADVTIIPHVFQTSYAAVDRDLPKLLAKYRPDALLMLGLHRGQSCYELKRVHEIDRARFRTYRAARCPAGRSELMAHPIWCCHMGDTC